MLHFSKSQNKPPNTSSNNYSLIILRPSSNTYRRSNAIIPRKSRDIPKVNNKKSTKIDEIKLRRLVLKGLGMKKMPDMTKVNISQVEYSNKYIEYLDRLRSNHENSEYSLNSQMVESSISDLHLFSIVTNRFNDISHKRWRHRRSLDARKSMTNILLHFPLSNIKEQKLQHNKIDEANVRLMILYSSSLAKVNNSHRKHNNKKESYDKNCNFDKPKGRRVPQNRQINLKVYQLLSSNRRRLLTSRKIQFENINYEETRTQWLEFDVTRAVRDWLSKAHPNLGIEIQCDRCKTLGVRVLSDTNPTAQKSSTGDEELFNLMPVLNIIGHGAMQSDSKVHHITLTHNKSDHDPYVHHNTRWGEPVKWNNSCYKLHQRCCRNQLDVAFKDIKGFEFILQPKVFDAGYCHGRCPPRHNPAHHHALLQSLIWQEDHSRAPRPCCAPSKLEMLEILHIDENHSDKLKISTWSDMQIVECACS
ncbi:LOW QUALITY PROTEIN: bone morphogenetic protein 4 [Drosophila serrata]|uniref:LOW QUALITY PROTEIN: bone morphogenetic protein 4 n=1 Tax=Drosophila serrata TaxID=7274 RepID=UPI000A1D0E68|nr:LOW QUALITY PROTEIN: bone morphogenetic protein 4 [Drosophila serrata]